MAIKNTATPPDKLQAVDGVDRGKAVEGFLCTAFSKTFMSEADLGDDWWEGGKATGQRRGRGDDEDVEVVFGAAPAEAGLVSEEVGVAVDTTTTSTSARKKGKKKKGKGEKRPASDGDDDSESQPPPPRKPRTAGMEAKLEEKKARRKQLRQQQSVSFSSGWGGVEEVVGDAGRGKRDSGGRSMARDSGGDRGWRRCERKTRIQEDPQQGHVPALGWSCGGGGMDGECIHLSSEFPCMSWERGWGCGNTMEVWGHGRAGLRTARFCLCGSSDSAAPPSPFNSHPTPTQPLYPL